MASTFPQMLAAKPASERGDVLTAFDGLTQLLIALSAETYVSSLLPTIQENLQQVQTRIDPCLPARMEGSRPSPPQRKHAKIPRRQCLHEHRVPQPRQMFDL
jgi:hypothetical protein